MPEIVADLPAPSCSLLLSETGIQESQSLGPDPFLPRARNARGRFASGSSGNPRGRPRGIRNPKRRVSRSCRTPAERGGAVESARPQTASVAVPRHTTLATVARRRRPGGAPRDRPVGVAHGRRLRASHGHRSGGHCAWRDRAPSRARASRRVRARLRWARKLARAGSVGGNGQKQPASSYAKGYVADPVSSRGTRH